MPEENIVLGIVDPQVQVAQNVDPNADADTIYLTLLPPTITQDVSSVVVSDNYLKRYIYKIYDKNGNFVTSWDKYRVITKPTFSSQINGGFGQLVIELALLENNYGENQDIKYGNRIKVICFDRDSGTEGVEIYSGVLSSYTPFIKGRKEGLKVTFLSHIWEAGRMMYDDGTVTEFVHNSTDPSSIMIDILSKYTARGGSLTGVIANTGSTVSYTFNTSTILEAMKKVLELSPEGWYFRTQANDTIFMNERSSDPDHVLTLGSDIMEYEPQKRVEDMVNIVYFTGDGIYRKYERIASINEYGEYAYKMVDNRVSSSVTAGIMANALLNKKDSPEIRVRVKISDNNGLAGDRGYDIESLLVGQTVQIKNATSKADNLWDVVQWDTDAWDFDITNASSTVLQIMKVDYTPEYAILELSNRLPDIARRIEDISRNLVDDQTANNPSTPTV